MRGGATFCLWVTVLCGVALYAQEYRGRIQGTITDPSQAAVAGATVTLANVATNVSTTRNCNQTGHYLFDMIEPGAYTLKVEMSGFAVFRAEGIVLRQRDDVTVDAVLGLSNVSETVEVSAQAAQVQFNTSRFETTVDSQLTSSLPQFFRDPFFLSKADPSVSMNDTRRESQPFYSTGGASQVVGGATTPDLQVDGARVGIGTRTAYVPPPDSVQDVNVQVSAVDAEYGYSTGAAVSVTMKSGTNAWHGGLFYQGVYPWANAVLDPVNRTQNVQRNHMFGGTLGQPIKKNKWFNFVAFEAWRLTDPQLLIGEVPTALERTGDYSQSLNNSGALRTIYDPWTTNTSPNGATVQRTPYPGNKIPASSLSRVASMYAAALPQPNGPGTGYYHANNYASPIAIKTRFDNFSDRTDFNINARLQYSGRVSLFRTPLIANNPTGNDLGWHSDRTSQRNGTTVNNSITWTKSPTTVINAGLAYAGMVDESNPQVGNFKGYASLWPNSTWYTSMFSPYKFVAVSPGMSFTMANGQQVLSSYSNGIGTNGPYWINQPHQYSPTVKITQVRGKHYLKAGFENLNLTSNQVPLFNYPNFSFNANSTSSTYVNPNTLVSGDSFASFLVGAVTGASMPVRQTAQELYHFFGGYINDDWKVGRRLTLNLGLRYEYEMPFREASNQTSRGPDLTVPIPEFQGSGAPQMPAQVKQFYTGPWTFNGAYRWSQPGHLGQWNSSRGTLSPRVGFALRLTDTMSARVGFGHYIAPWGNDSANIINGTFYGYSFYNSAVAPILGIPQMSLDDPFNSSQPLMPMMGKTYGTYSGLGDPSGLSWYAADRVRQWTNRYNFSFQRSVPGGMVVDVTYFLQYSNAPATRNLNMVDPMIGYTYKAATNISVANPFYQILTPSTFPGAMRSQQTVSLSALMVPYPQYGALNDMTYDNTNRVHYRQFSIRVRKSYSHGLTFTAGYSNTHQSSFTYYDDAAQYQEKATWIANVAPGTGGNTGPFRHRISLAGNWQLPLGRDRAFLSSVPRVVDAIIGGWSFSPLLTWRSGTILVFRGLVANGDPHVANPGMNQWFNQSMFSILPAYTQRTNPVTYEGITGPGYFNLDLSIAKSFRIEKFSAELRVDSFNATNSMTWNDPSTSYTSSYFGKSSDAMTANGAGVGRVSQIGLRIHF
jgi:hypothetical protein